MPLSIHHTLSFLLKPYWHLHILLYYYHLVFPRLSMGNPWFFKKGLWPFLLHLRQKKNRQFYEEWVSY